MNEGDTGQGGGSGIPQGGHHLLEAMVDAVFVTDPGGRLQWMNRAARAALAGVGKRATGDELRSALGLGSESSGSLLEAIGAGTVLQLRLETALAGLGDALCSCSPVHDGQGKLAGALLVVRAAPVQHASASECEARFQALVEHAADAFFLISEESGRFVDVNRRAVELLGYTREELLSLGVADVDPAFPRAKTPAQAFERLAPDGTTTLPGYQVRKDGSQVPVEIRCGFCTLGDKRYVLALARDITERKAAEEELRQAQRLEAVGTLAGGVAHDFNNLLVPILGYSEMLATQARPDDPNLEPLQAIRAAAFRARELTHQLLAFSRKQVIMLRPVGLGYVINAFEPILRRMVREDIDFDVYVEPDAGTIRGDATQLERVIMNLVSNAQDAIPNRGRIKLEVCNVEVDRALARTVPELGQGPHVMLSVHDTGEGMQPHVREHLFEPFFTTKPRHKGTGLGLATVHGIVKQHGGAVWFEGEPGRGTVFHVCFPRVPPAAELATRGSEPAQRLRGNETVAVAEDDAAVLELVCRALQSSGYRVLRSDSAAACIQVMTSHAGPVHLLLADVVMPDLGALELHRRLMAERPSLRLLCMSGHSAEVLSERGVGSETMILRKPFTLEVLLAAVRDALDR